MKILRIHDFYWADAVNTEEAILANLGNASLYINSNFFVAYYSWSSSINNSGLAATQQMIREFQNRVKDSAKLIFVCQHILVDRLDWGASIVFTPHSTYKNGFQPIAHYSKFFYKPYLPISKRPLLASFVGSYSTHNIRSRLANILQSRIDCLVLDTGVWHYEKPPTQKYTYEKKYIESLKNSKFVFCPRGTGPSSIRIWEALSSGCIPIIISDELIIPEPLAKIVPTIPSYTLRMLPNILEELSARSCSTKFLNLQDRLVSAHNKYTSNDSLHIPLLQYISIAQNVG